jgi:hypothetical protein
MARFDDLIPVEACLQEKEKKMTEKKNFRIGYHDYAETAEDAISQAQVKAEQDRSDVIVWGIYATVKYPIPTYPVEMATPAVTPAAA